VTRGTVRYCKRRCHREFNTPRLVEARDIAAVPRPLLLQSSVSVASEQFVDAGLGACFGIDLFDDHCAIETVKTVRRRKIP
jgi:hypothetical protein